MAARAPSFTFFFFFWNLIKLKFLERFLKNSQILHFGNIHPVGAKFHADGRQVDMIKVIPVFRNFENANKHN